MKVGAIQCEKGVEKYIVKIKTNLNDFQLCSRHGRDVTNDASTPIEASVSALHKKWKRYHGLVPWNFMFAANSIKNKVSRCHGLVPGSLTFTAI
jgi:hypothetical protein